MRIAACLAALTLALSATTTGAAMASQQAPPQPRLQQPGSPRPADEDTVSQNLLHDGWDPNDAALSPATVKGGTFGQTFARHVDGQVYAQPLVVDNPGTSATAPSTSVIVATEKDTVYSLDGTTGQVLWSRNLGTAWSSGVTGCGDLTPYIGITSTPVYDPATHEVYVVALIAGSSPANPHPAYYVFALDEHTGFVEWKTPVHGPPVNAPGQAFVASLERQRTGLLLMNGWLYFGFASFCDIGSYKGLVSGVNTGSRAQTMWTAETGSGRDQAGIWMSGGGLMSDGPGRIFLSTGNGVSPPPGPGTRPPSELGDSVVRLSQNSSTGALTSADFFSPANAPTLDRQDGDLGSGGVVGLPVGTSTYPRLLVQAGKDGRVFLLNRDNLGGREQGGGGSDKVVGESGPFGGQWGHPAAFAGAGGDDYVYYSGSGEGWSDYLRVLKFNGHTASHPELVDVANSPGTFGFTSGSPVITSDGDASSSAILWEVDSSGSSGVRARLEAYDAVPAPGQATLTQIWSAPIGTAVKFTVPATDDGHVYVGARNDGVNTSEGIVYGFAVSKAIPLVSGQVSFGAVGVGASKTVTATVAATQAMEVTGLTLTSAASPVPLTLGTPAVNGRAVTAFPVSLTAGQQLTVPVTLAPAATGAVTGSVDIATNVPGFPAVSVPLTGTGATAGLAAYPSPLAFGTTGPIPDSAFNGPVPVGGTQAYPIDITNTGTTAETISSVTPPAAPFTLSGPLAGAVLQAGQSVTASVTYAPTTVTNSDAGSFTVADSAGHTVTVPLSGISVAGSAGLTPSATSVSFGKVALGSTASAAVQLANNGNLPLTVTGFTAPATPFGTPVPVAKGLTVDPGDSISLPVTMTPQSKGAADGAYQITGTYGAGQVTTLTLPVSGNGVAPASGVVVPSPGGGWTLNGAAAMHGTTLDLTAAAPNQAGSAVYYQPLSSSGLRVTFTMRASGGTGGDGMTFSLLNTADPVTSLGTGNGLLGVGGLSAVSVVLGTERDAGDPSANFVGIATGSSGNHLVFLATTSRVPSLRSGSHVIGVTVTGKVISVTVDGRAALSATAPLPATVLPAFTASTSALTDAHVVSGVSIQASTSPVPPPGGGWSFNGSAVMSGSDVDLTRAAANQAGTVIYPRAVSTAYFRATFTVQIGGGTGANGMAFALLNPTDKVTSTGDAGAGMGLVGLPGVAVVLSTYRALGDPSGNYIAFTAGWLNGQPAIKASSSAIAPLRTGTHTVSIVVRGGEMGIYLDGAGVLRHPVSMPSALLAFTAGTGHETDVHAVRDAGLAATAW